MRSRRGTQWPRVVSSGPSHDCGDRRGERPPFASSHKADASTDHAAGDGTVIYRDRPGSKLGRRESAVVSSHVTWVSWADTCELGSHRRARELVIGRMGQSGRSTLFVVHCPWVRVALGHRECGDWRDDDACRALSRSHPPRLSSPDTGFGSNASAPTSLGTRRCSPVALHESPC